MIFLAAEGVSGFRGLSRDFLGFRVSKIVGFVRVCSVEV